MKIISTPDYSSWKKVCKCFFCSTELEIIIKDLQYKIEKKWYSGGYYDDGYYANIDYFYVVCPVCDKDINVHTGDVPLLIQEQLRTSKKKKK